MSFKLSGTTWPARLFGLAMILAGIGGWFYNHHLAATEGEFYVRLCVFSPLGVLGGLLMLLRPEWSGPPKKDSPRAQKVSLFAILGIMTVFSGLDLYSLNTTQAPRRFQSAPRIHFTPDMGTPKLDTPAR
jgi:hypothetical protein